MLTRDVASSRQHAEAVRCRKGKALLIYGDQALLVEGNPRKVPAWLRRWPPSSSRGIVFEEVAPEFLSGNRINRNIW